MTRVVATCEIRTVEPVTEAGRVSTKWGDVEAKVGEFIVKDSRGEIVMVYTAEDLAKEYTELQGAR